MLVAVVLTFAALVPGNGSSPSSWKGTSLWPTVPKHSPRATSTDLDRLKAEDGGVLVKIGKEGMAPTFVLWGDSLALALLTGVDHHASLKSRAGFYVNIGQSYPFDPRKDREPVLQWLEARSDLTQVLLVNSWLTGKLRDDQDGEEVVAICRRLRAAFEKGTAYPLLARLVEQLQSAGLATIIHSEEAFATEGGYRVVEHGKALFQDATHVNSLGAEVVLGFAAPLLWPEGEAR